MIILYILLALILLIALILFLNISFVFELKEEFKFKIKVLFITLTPDRISSIADAFSKEEKEPVSSPHGKKRKKSFSEVVEDITTVIDLIKAVFGELIRYARLKVCLVDVKIATEDAAQTALVYGAASSAVYVALEFLDTILLLKKNYKKISVYPDFTTDKSEVNLKIILRIKPIHLLLAAVHLLPTLAEKKKGK